MCNLEANTECFAFINCSNFAFSKIKVIKFLKNFVKRRPEL